HEWFVSEAKGKEADVLFIGDDHIALFEQSFVYREHFAPLHCLCFGALGDRITDLRWRLENKVLEGLNPKFKTIAISYAAGFMPITWPVMHIVIVVSTGNLDYGLSKDELLNGMKEVAEIIKRQKPMSRIFFMLFISRCPISFMASQINTIIEAWLLKSNGSRVKYVGLSTMAKSAHFMLEDMGDVLAYRHHVLLAKEVFTIMVVLVLLR
uniref:Uncharacterized protein n=1 Tax=Parascaris equorum TaxID=6256 RepID=A0A914R6C2_PAREQ